MKIFLCTDSRGMWPKEYSWPNVLNHITKGKHQIQTYIGGIDKWLTSIYLTEKLIKDRGTPDKFFDLIVVQGGWHEGGPCFWTKEVWKEIIGDRFNESCLVNEIDSKGHKKYLYIDPVAEKEIFEFFKLKSKHFLFIGTPSLRQENDLGREYGLGMEHHYKLLESNNRMGDFTPNHFNYPMDDLWVAQNTLPDRIHFNYNGVNFISQYLHRYIERIDKTLVDILKESDSYQSLYQKALFFGSSICQLTQEGDKVILASKISEDLLAQFLGCVIYKRIPLIIQRPSTKVFTSEFEAKMIDIKNKISPTLCICQEEDRSLFNQFFQSLSEMKESEVTDLPETKMDDLAFIQLSSGTTGNVKIIEVTHKQLIENCQEYAISINLNKNSKITSWLPLYHDMGLITSFLLPIIIGCDVSLIDTFEWVMKPQSILEEITRFQTTHVWMPNFAFKLVENKTTSFLNINLSSLEKLISCSEPTFKEDMDSFYGKFSICGLKPNVISNCYALAENVFAVSQSDSIKTTEHKGVHYVSCGKTIAGVSVLIEKDEKDVTDVEEGLVMIKSSSEPNTNTKSSFFGYYNTGDIGFIKDGELYIIGRQNDSFVSFGNNIYPTLIEQEINSIAGVHAGRVSCFGLENKTLGTKKVCVVAEADDLKEEQGIKTHITKRCKEFFDVSPEVIIAPLNYIIKTSSGKVSRSKTKTKVVAHFKVLNLINEFLKSKNKPIINFNDTIYSSGRLDSIEILELVLFLERNGIVIPKNELKLNLDSLDTVGQIVGGANEI